MSKRAARRLHQVVNGSRDAYVEVDRRGRITEWSSGAKTLLGWTRDEMLGRPASGLATRGAESVAHGIDALRSATCAVGETDFPEVVATRVPLLASDGLTVVADSRVFTTGKRSALRVCAFLWRAGGELAPAVARRHAEVVAQQRPSFASQTTFARRLASAADALDGGSSVAVAVIELDRFGVMTDALGGDCASLALAEVADRLAASASFPKSPALFARRGAGQYLALFARADGDAEAAAERFARRFLRALELPVAIGGHELLVSASVGVCAARSPVEDATDLVSNAATAAYEGSRAGGRQVKMFDRSMKAELLERVATESALHRALGGGELFVRYQPIVDMSSSSTVSLEALVRWRHPELGVVGPERFIPIAEDTGLIVPIGAWVLEEACRQLAHWRAGPWPALDSVAVNLSARQIEDPEVVELVRRVMACTRLSGRSLVCEITESTLMRDAEASLGVLRALKAAGVVLAVDDFGTGYSSLSYLRHLPVDILKIDKCFVQSIDEGESTKIVAAMVNLGHELGMVVAAEGVETAAQAQVLRALGCDLAQGMWYASPLDASEVPLSGTTGSQLARNEPRRVSRDT